MLNCLFLSFVVLKEISKEEKKLLIMLKKNTEQNSGPLLYQEYFFSNVSLPFRHFWESVKN